MPRQRNVKMSKKSRLRKDNFDDEVAEVTNRNLWDGIKQVHKETGMFTAILFVFSLVESFLKNN